MKVLRLAIKVGLNVGASVAAIIAAGVVSGAGNAHGLSVTQSEPPTLEVTHRARAVAPGEVVLVDVRAPMPLHDVQATWMSQTIYFYEVQAREWRALLPIDVAAAAGRQVLTVQAKAPDNHTMERAYPIDCRAAYVPGASDNRRREVCGPSSG